MDYKRTLNNWVLIRLDGENNSVKLKSGIELYVDCSYEPERNATVTGTIVGLPSHLQYTGIANVGMPWDCPLEAKLGDKCVVYYLSIVNALKPQESRCFVENGERYVIIQYNFIYALIREEKIIPINGFCLIEPVDDPAIIQQRERIKRLGLATVDMYQKKSNQVTFGKVRYLAVPNRRYVDENSSDEGVDIAVDDIVVIRKTSDIPLQYSLHAKLDGGTKYLRIQRRNILGKI